MKTRIITGAGYVAVMIAFFLLRELVNAKIFHILTGFLIVAGTIECARLTKGRSFNFVKPLAICYAVAFILAYLVTEWFLPSWGKIVAFDLTAIMVVVLCVYAIVKKSTTEALKYSVLPFVYPSLFLLTMLCANDLRINGFIILLLSFVISPLSDTFAYFTGKLIGGKKLCPKISPKKTWAGAIGGTIGGALGSLVVYLIVKPKINFFSPALFFILIGLFASIINIFGDLFESLLKRRVGVKDSGKLLPGHGGVLDRIDGTMFVVPFLYLVFLLV
jgi:phosphatidate cytidylyltransferase